MSLRERLACLNSDYVEYVGPEDDGGKLTVRETKDDGFAELDLRVAPGMEAISLTLSNDKVLRVLANQKSADGHLLVREPDGWSARVIECKRTLRANDLDKATQQIVSSMVRLQMMADFLGVPIRRWRADIACRHDHTLPETSTNPTAFKPMASDGWSEAGTRTAIVAWPKRQVDGPLGIGPVVVAKIMLDEEGRGALPP